MNSWDLLLIFGLTNVLCKLVLYHSSRVKPLVMMFDLRKLSSKSTDHSTYRSLLIMLYTYKILPYINWNSNQLIVSESSHERKPIATELEYG